MSAASVPAVPDSTARATLMAALLGFFVITLDAVVVNVALPTLGHELDAGITGLQWVVDGYTLAFAALLLSAGALTDRLGARRAFGGGVVVFGLASLACGAAPDLATLISARFAQGVGAAVMMPSSMALVRQAYSDPVKQVHAIALWAMGGAVAATAGPVIGGVLVAFDWRWIFLVNLPVGLLTLACLSRARPSPKRFAPFDGWGQLTAMVAMGALIYGAIDVGRHDTHGALALAALAIAAVAFALFVMLQRRAAHPMVPPAVLQSRNARVSMVVGFTFMVGYFGLPFVMSLYFQQERGLSAAATGVAFLPMMLIGLVLTPFTSRLVQRFTAKRLITSGLLCMAFGLVAIAVLPATAPVWWLSAMMVLVGLAGPLIAPPVTAILLSSVPHALTGTASGVFNTSRQVGGALAVAVFGALLAQSPGFMAGLRTSLVVAAAVALITAAISLRLQPPTAQHGRV
ncbi:drug:proton antiporter [Alcanivorax sp. S71-1-4]|uniref:MFS transporter n=1 Tax=Alcanivorax sp. S71-1-4 TaxID=1177159 RepID=UPI0016A08E84|nr:MFS transporter [Alcanivorax sp. S71-1-4]KAF0810308.1 drug:proton antiporter [Alcanivorax sp. S71-1-4]